LNIASKWLKMLQKMNILGLQSTGALFTSNAVQAQSWAPLSRDPHPVEEAAALCGVDRCLQPQVIPTHISLEARGPRRSW
jgi:hypothetical protein